MASVSGSGDRETLIEFANHIKTIVAHSEKASYLERPSFGHKVHKFVAIFIKFLDAAALMPRGTNLYP